MAELEKEFEKLNLDSSSSGEDCPHQKLLRINDEDYSYQCKKCHQQCRVSFECRSSASSSSDGSNNSIEFKDPSNSNSDKNSQSSSIQFEGSSSSSIQFRDVSNASKRDESMSTPSQPLPTSRLLDEFEYMNVILGHGGYGSVAKFRNKKDDQIYAIKKTKATQRNETEVKVLSNLHHDNIVRYYNCWTEPNDSAFPKSTEEEGSSEATEEEEELAPRSGAVLYIQMEFFESRTLREVINSGDFVRDRSRMWILFRQLVEGINYFHNKKIIHRDLKPENVFLKSENCVKIGDFGLATAQPNSNATLPGTLGSSSSRLTTQCGSNFYMAPELATGRYDTKADMYSLGIISFEMCHPPFVTEMERRTELTKLRAEPDYEAQRIVLPLFVEQFMMNYSGQDIPLLTKDMGENIVKLLNKDPTKRPSAQELLRSSHMPPPLLDKLNDFFQLVKSIVSSRRDLTDSREYDRLMEVVCLEQDTPEYEIFFWLYLRRSYKDDKSSLVFRNDSLTIHDHPHILKYFIRRCQESKAQYFQPASLFPKMSAKKDYDCKELKKLAVILENNYNQSSQSFVDYRGTMPVLPVDSYTSLARHIVSHNVMELKRFSIHPVYVGDRYFGPPEPSNIELAYDIVTPNKNLRQADADVIKVFEKVSKDCKLSSIAIQLNHRLIIEAILIYCKVPVDQRSQKCRQLREYNHHRSGPSHAMLVPILKLLDFTGPLDRVKAHLDSLTDWIGSESAYLADRAFKELEEIIHYLSRANNQRGLNYSIHIHLKTGIENYDTHSGYLFSFIHKMGSKKVAKGGRYDSLVEAFHKVVNNCPFPELGQGLDKSFLNAKRIQHAAGGAIYLNELIIAEGKEMFPNLPLVWD